MVPRVKVNAKDRFIGFWRRDGLWGPPGKLQNFTNDQRLLIVDAVIWPKYFRYGVKHYISNLVYRFAHIGMSSLPMKSITFWSMLSARCHLAVRVFLSEPHLSWHDTCIYNGHFRALVTLKPAECLVVELTLPVYVSVSTDLGLSLTGNLVNSNVSFAFSKRTQSG